MCKLLKSLNAKVNFLANFQEKITLLTKPPMGVVNRLISCFDNGARQTSARDGGGSINLVKRKTRGKSEFRVCFLKWAQHPPTWLRPDAAFRHGGVPKIKNRGLTWQGKVRRNRAEVKRWNLKKRKWIWQLVWKEWGGAGQGTPPLGMRTAVGVCGVTPILQIDLLAENFRKKRGGSMGATPHR